MKYRMPKLYDKIVKLSCDLSLVWEIYFPWFSDWFRNCKIYFLRYAISSNCSMTQNEQILETFFSASQIPIMWRIFTSNNYISSCKRHFSVISLWAKWDLLFLILIRSKRTPFISVFSAWSIKQRTQSKKFKN